jgi:ATP-binding cassette subfamily B multidrug efflux pump
MDGILRAVSIFFIVAVLGVLGRVFWRMTLARMTHVAGYQFKRGIWQSIRLSSFDSLGRYTLGDLMNRSIADVNAARWIYGFTLVLTCDVIFFTILGAISMMVISPIIACLCLTPFVLIPPIAIRVARLEFHAHEAAQAELTVLSESVSQAVRSIRSQRASQTFMSWIRALNDSALRYSRLRLRSQNIAIDSFPLFCLPTILSYAVLLTLGPSKVAEGSMSIGGFAALASYIYLLQGPLGEIGDLVAEWQRGFASLKRIAEIRNLEQHANKTHKHEQERDMIVSVSDVHVKRQGRILFSDVSLVMRSGQWIGLSGAVGCGKSTLLQVLCGVAPFEKGVVSIGSDLRSGVPRQIAYAPEKPFVFSGSIRRNLSLNLTFTDEQLWDVLRLVALEEHVRSITGGLDGLVGEGGVALSGGQRQRLALARVLLRVDGLLVLDDPLSAVDAATESKIIFALRERFRHCSVIWASNKISTLSCCDRVLRLTRDGLRQESGEIHLKTIIYAGPAQEVACPIH